MHTVWQLQRKEPSCIYSPTPPKLSDQNKILCWGSFEGIVENVKFHQSWLVVSHMWSWNLSSPVALAIGLSNCWCYLVRQWRSVFDISQWLCPSVPLPQLSTSTAAGRSGSTCLHQK